MSLRSMAVMRAQGEANPPDGDQKKLLDQLVALVPTEAVGLYLLGIGAAAEADEWVRWVWFGLVLVLTPVLVTVSYWEKKGGRSGIPWFEVSVGVVAYLAWTTTVPRGTFDELGVPVWVGTLVVGLVSVILTIAVRAKAVWAKKQKNGGPSPAPADIQPGVAQAGT